MIDLNEILLKDVMITSPIALNTESKFSLVKEYFDRYHIRHIPVVDADNILKGIITQRDLFKLYSPKKTMEGNEVYNTEELNRIILKYVMTKNPLTLSPEDKLGKAVKLMVSTKYGCIPIVDKDNKLIGIITPIDILKALAANY